MQAFPELVRRHRVDPGPLVHVGGLQDRAIPAFYEAGFFDITVVDSDPERVRALRTRFPGVDFSTEGAERIDAASVLVINTPGYELDLLSFVPWGNLTLLIVATNTKDGDSAVSSYDLVTELVTTRGFIEVDRWTREPYDGADTNVAFLRP